MNLEFNSESAWHQNSHALFQQFPSPLLKYLPKVKAQEQMHLVFLHPNIRPEPRILIWLKQSVQKVLAMALILISFTGFLQQPAYLTALACCFKKMHPSSKHSNSLNKKVLEHPPPMVLSLSAKGDRDISFPVEMSIVHTLGKHRNASVVWLL